MINKKILAVAVATAFSTNALATVALTASNQDIKFASEVIVPADLNGDGLLETIDTNTAGALDVTSIVGFTIGAGTSKYIRIDLTDAEFGDTLIAADLTVTSASTTTESLSQGGSDGDDFAIFEVAAATLDVSSADAISFDISDLDISVDEASTVTVTTYETAADAVNQTNPLFTDSSAYTSVVEVANGDITVPNDLIATVGSQFTTFDEDDAVGTPDVTEASVGEIDIDLLLAAGTFYHPETAVVVIADVVATTQDVTVTGDFSFGAWEFNTLADCSGAATALTIAADELSASRTAAVLTLDTFLCVDNAAADTVLKSAYSAELVDDELTGDMGSIVYNTTSIEVPYLTTFTDYKQRLYIVNNSGSAALYSTTFTAEDGVVVTPGAAATGTVPANEMLMILATDMVSLVGKTRVSAVIEIEATDADVMATTQTVNISDKSTDTVVLN